MKEKHEKINWYYYRLEDGRDDRFICQYMRLDYLIQMLETGNYHINRRKTFEDANEGYKNIKYEFGIQPIGKGIPKQPEIKKRFISYSDIVDCPTTCWSKTARESFLMWKSYASEVGVCIRSTVHHVISSLKIDLDINSNENRVLCGSMDYKDWRPSTDEEKQLFDKDKVFADENEFRFYFHLASDDKNGNNIVVPVDTKVMIDKVLLSPFMCKDAANKLARMIMCAYDIEVKPSSIKLKQ